MEEDIKRQRIQYNGDQIYPNVSFNNLNIKKPLKNNSKIPQLWSSKWCGVKEEPKQQQLGISSVISMSTPPHNNNNNPPNNSNPASNNNNNPSANNNNSSYYDTHNVFPSSVNNNNNQDAILSYDSITTISQAQNTLYAPSIGTAIGEFRWWV